MSEVTLSVIAPFYNEGEGLREFVTDLKEVCDSLECSYEVILVDDGSTDESVANIVDVAWPECTVVQLVANAGHQNALDAGLRQATGRWVVTMDADGQHPPETIKDLLLEIREQDCDIVYAVPRSRSQDSWVKRSTASLYYSAMRLGSGVNIRANAADFRIMSRRVVDAVNGLQEPKIFRLLLPSLGYPEAELSYDVRQRAFGESKYTFRKMLSLGLRSVVSFSPLPLRWVSILGILTALAAFALIVLVILSYALGSVVPGWASVMVVVLLFGGIQLVAIGTIGEYLVNLQAQVRGRPHFLIRKTISLGD